MAGKVAIDGIGNRGNNEDGDGGVPPEFLRGPDAVGVAVGNDEGHENWDQNEADDGDAGGPSHILPGEMRPMAQVLQATCRQGHGQAAKECGAR